MKYQSNNNFYKMQNNNTKKLTQKMQIVTWINNISNSMLKMNTTLMNKETVTWTDIA